MGTVDDGADNERWRVGDDVIVAAEAQRRALRLLFLAVIHRDALPVIHELAALPSDAEVPRWADRHHLAQEWVCAAAIAARAFWREFLAAGATPVCWPVDGDAGSGWEHDAWMPATRRHGLPESDPRAVSYRAPKPRPGEKETSFGTRLRAHEAARRAELKAIGLVPNRERVDPDHLRWVVRRVILSESYTAIAGDYDRGIDCGKVVRRLRKALPL